MKEILSKFNKWDYVFLALLGMGYCFLIIQYIPCWEDIYYSFDRSANEYSCWIASLNDAIRSQCYEYTHVNGRFLVHVLVQWFCGCTGPIPFFIGSTTAAILLIMGIVYLIRRRDNKSYLYEIPLVTLLLLLFIPRISITYLGHIAFTMNYMWGSCLYIWFLILYLKLLNNEIKLNWWKNILLCLYAAICGQWQESFGIGIGGALFIYHLIHIKETKGSLLAYLLSFAIGLLTNILAPGNFMRTSEKGILQSSNIIDIVKILFSSLSSVTFSMSFIIFLLVVTLIFFINRKHEWEYIKENYLFILPSFIAFLFAIIIAFVAEHQLCMPVLMTVILFCMIIHDNYCNESFQNICITTTLLAFLLGLYIPINYKRNLVIEKAEIFISSMSNAPDSVANSHLIENYMEYDIKNSYFQRYVNTGIVPYVTKEGHLKLSHYLTRDTSILTTMALPEPIPEIVAQCNDSSSLTNNMFRFTKNPNFYIVKVPESISSKDVNVKYLIEPSTRNQKIKYFITGQKPDTVKVPLINEACCREFTYDGYRYIINRNDIFVTRYKDIRYLEVIY